MSKANAAITLSLAALLSACGGGGSVGSAPPPPSITTYFYTTATAINNADFALGSVSASHGVNHSSPQTMPLGSGVAISYVRSSDTYRLSLPDGSATTFAPADRRADPGPGVQGWTKISGTQTDNFYLTHSPGITLQYTLLGDWESFNTASGAYRNSVFLTGQTTQAGDMPKAGAATYQGSISGSVQTTPGSMPYRISTSSDSALSANFATGTISTSLQLAGQQLGDGSASRDFGTFSGTGTITSASSAFNGTMTGPDGSGAFAGAFFGPAATEMGYVWEITGSDFRAMGQVSGKKN